MTLGANERHHSAAVFRDRLEANIKRRLGCDGRFVFCLFSMQYQQVTLPSCIFDLLQRFDGGEHDIYIEVEVGVRVLVYVHGPSW